MRISDWSSDVCSSDLLYWLRPGFDRVALRAPKIAAELFDTGVNMGTGTATGFLQRALNALNRAARDYPDIAVDRAIGPRTLSALDGLLKARGRRSEAHTSELQSLMRPSYACICLTLNILIPTT